MASQSSTDTETTTTEPDPEKVETAAAESASPSTESSKSESSSTESSSTESPKSESPSGTTADTAKAAATPVAAGTVAADKGTTAGTSARDSSGVGVAAGAMVAAGLGIGSLTGTSLGDMMRAREELLGQIAAATGGGQMDQIDALYGAPWHTVATVNAVVALLAVIVGGVLLLVPGRRPGTPTWVKALALGGTLLGVVGLIVAGGMYFDLFASAPVLPPMPAMGGMGGGAGG